MRRSLIAIAAGAGIAAALAFASPAQAATAHHAAPTAEVSVLHAVPNTPVDVYLDHTRILNDFQPGSLAGPLKVSAGKHLVSITAASAKNDAAPVIGPVRLTFDAHGDYTIVAHLTSSGAPTATLYRNDVSSTKHGDGRVIVRHDAAAPAVDVLVNGSAVVHHLSNPHQAALVVKSGTYSVAVALAGTTKPVIGPVSLAVWKGYDTIVYAWGSAAKGDLAVAVQHIPLHHTCR